MKVTNPTTSTFSLRHGDNRELWEVGRGKSAEVPANLADHPRLKSALANGRLVEDKSGGGGESPKQSRAARHHHE